MKYKARDTKRMEYPTQKKSPLPDLDRLHIRHRGLTKNLCGAYAEAASVCLSKHHIPPVEFEIRLKGLRVLREVSWIQPDALVKGAWNNADDATRDGAYSICLAAVEAELGLVAVTRAETRTGADYYVGQPDLGLEEAYRLEVSGIDHGDVTILRRRVTEKVGQTKKPASNRPAIVAVVGFLIKHLTLEPVEK